MFQGVVRDPNRHQTAMHIAAAGSNIALMHRLLDARAGLDATDSYGHTPLHVALVAEDDEDDLCMGSGVRIHGIKSRPERNGKFGAIIGPFEEASGRWPVLVEEGPPEGVLLKPDNISPVFSDSVDFLLGAGADVNLGNHKLGLDHSMLHQAACTGNLANAERAIAHGANVNMQRAGSLLTALHMAVRKRSTEMIETLLKARADPRLTDAHGKTAIDLAAINNVSAETRAALAA